MTEASKEIKKYKHIDKKSPKIKKKNVLDPVRYGDWEKNGRCIDF